MGRTPSLLVVLCLAISTAASAEDGESSFNAANKYFAEQSSSRACDAFGDFLQKFPSSGLASEARVKRARSCLAVGKDYNKAIADLKAGADGEGDAFSQALANLTLSERGDNYTKRDNRGRGSLALDQLQVAARAGGRTGKEARSYFFRLALSQQQQSMYDLKRVEALTEQILRMEPSNNDRGLALFQRATAWVRQGGELVKKGEKELLDVGAGNSEWADDALYMLAAQKSSRSDFVGALAIYDEIRTRWNGTNSNVHSEAVRQAEHIRRPVISASFSYFELPGQKPELRIDFRNVKRAQVTLKRLDPMKIDPSSLIDDGDPANLTAKAKTIREWSVELKEPGQYVPGTLSSLVDVPGDGAYIVDVTASDGVANSRAWTLVTPNSAALKVSRERVAAFIADTMTGQAVKGAKVYFAVQFYDQKSGREDEQRFDAQTDDQGVAVVDVKEGRPIRNVVLWAQAGETLTYARGYSNSYYNDNKDYLAYVATDRPLYKPGENVGAKVFLRSRADGPSTPVPGGEVTVRVYDPQSREIKVALLKTNDFGTASFDIPLAKDAMLGLYRFYVQSNSQSYQQAQATFRVEEYKPPEFTVSVEPVGAPEPGKPIKMKVTASRYSGGPVANANGRAVITERGYMHTWAPWEDDVQVGWWSWYGGGYNNYDEDDGYSYKRGRHYGGYYQQVFKQTTLVFKTGADGTAEVEIPAPADENDRSFLAQVFVTDATRREVTGSGTINVSRTPFFVDIRSDRYLYKPGEQIKVKLRSEDANSRPMNPSLEVFLFRLEKDGTTSQILKRAVTLVGGRGEVTLDGDAVGAVRIQVGKPGATAGQMLATTDVWLTSDTKPIAPPNAGFNLYTDRAPLMAGGTLRALLVTPRAGGHAFITVEGQSLFFTKGIEMNGQARFIEVPLTGQMTPNAWLSVVRFEDTQAFTRQAVMKVSGSDTAIDVQVAHTADLIEPGMKQAANVTLKNFSGEAELMVTSVDEAIFAIEPMRKDFLSWFGRRPQQLWVTTALTQGQRTFRRPAAKQTPEPVLAQVAPAEDEFGANLDSPKRKAVAEEKAMAPSASAGARADDMESDSKLAKKESRSKKDMAPGDKGGGGADDEPVKVRSNFSSSAGWVASVKAQGRGSIPLSVPDSLTRFKTVVFAVSRGPHMGVGEAQFRTEKPLMVRLQAPRFFTERDEVTISALVSNRTARPVTAEVTFNVGNNLKPLDRTKKTVDVAANGDVRVDTHYVVVEPGEVSLQVTAKGGGKSDAMLMKLNVVTHGAAQRVSYSGRLGDAVSMKVKLPELRNANATRFELTLSPTLVSVMMDALPYLAQYPYGCVEQTLSRFVPAVIARRAAKDLGLPKTRVPADLDNMVSAGLDRLYNFQHGDGGWGWWQADTTNRGMTAYVVYGLSLAREAGVEIRSGVIERGRSWLINNAGAAENNADEQAFMVMALAHSGQVPPLIMDKAYNRRSKMSKRAKAQLALAMVKASDKRARIAVENLDDIFVAAKERAELSAGDANDQWSTSEAIETTAYALMAVSRYDLNSPHVKPLTDFLVLRRNGGKWRTTRDTAFSVYALSELARRERASTASGAFVVEVNGREVKRVRFGNGGMDLTEPLVLTDAVFKPGDNTVTLKRDGGGTGYYAAMFDVYNRDENVKGVGGDIKVTRRFTVLGKVAAVKDMVGVSAEYGMPVESGLRVRVDLEVKANKAMEYVMVEDLKPAGFEAVAQKSGPELCSYQCAHVELKTDRVAFFITNLNAGLTKYSYELRAEVPGKFHALPARVEAMYAPELRATSDEMRFDVRDAPEPLDVGVTENKP